jgi:uncharacterized short protein YbdD (DUF466 family)
LIAFFGAPVELKKRRGASKKFKNRSCNMAGIDDYQMYLAHQLSQEQRDEWERKHDRERQAERMRPRNLQLQTSGMSRQQLLQEVTLAEAEFQDGNVLRFSGYKHSS